MTAHRPRACWWCRRASTRVGSHTHPTAPNQPRSSSTAGSRVGGAGGSAGHDHPEVPLRRSVSRGVGHRLALLPLLLALALVPARRPAPTARPARPWNSQALAVGALLAASALIAGVGGVAVVGGALALGRLLRDRQGLLDEITLWTASVGLILAGRCSPAIPGGPPTATSATRPGCTTALIALGALCRLGRPTPGPPSRGRRNGGFFRTFPPKRWFGRESKHD